VIRRATQDDAPAFAAVIAAGQATWRSWAGPKFEPYRIDELRNVWAERLSASTTVAFCFEEPGSIHAVAAAGPEALSHQPTYFTSDSAHLSTLFARPESHGTGATQALHDELLKQLGLLGYTAARLWVPAGAVPARRFYVRNSWFATGKGVRFAGLDRLEMRRTLP
jgi:GNAT superfamily N-acetyltransferase